MLSDSPPERDVEWTDSGVTGAWKLVNRLWEAVEPHKEMLRNIDLQQTPEKFSESSLELRRATHSAILGVTDDIENFRFNKAIARIYEFLNLLRKNTAAKSADNSAEEWAMAEALAALTRLIAPFVPHLAEECWDILGGPQSGLGTLVCNVSWPDADESLTKTDTVTLGVQVNGKRRAELTVPADADKDAVEKLALSDEVVARHTEGKTIRKVVVVPGRVVNIVAN